MAPQLTPFINSRIRKATETMQIKNRPLYVIYNVTDDIQRKNSQFTHLANYETLEPRRFRRSQLSYQLSAKSIPHSEPLHDTPYQAYHSRLGHMTSVQQFLMIRHSTCRY